MADVHEYIDKNQIRYRSELDRFLSIPSISARSEHAPDVVRAAQWVHGRMIQAGLEATIDATEGHPVVIGEWRHAGPDKPRVLIYGHYDVQPVEPLDLWTTPPFEAHERDGRIYARGSVDDKGQLFLHLAAIEALAEVNHTLPLNIVVLAEGEEEIGSENLMPFVRQHAERLKCDYIVISDTTMFAPGMPTIGASLRGLAYFEINVRSPGQDLHSGTYGGAVLNPATALAHIIASFHDENGHVRIPGFYDDVNAAEDFREQIRKLPFNETEFLKETGSPALSGEAGFSTFERVWIRPTLEINGMLSGYTGEGSKTVLPSRAMAKVSCRLVPDQDPEKIRDQFTAYVKSVAPAGVEVDVAYLHGGKPWRAKLGGKLYEAAARALQTAFGREPVYAGEGGSIPITSDFERVLGAPVLLMGFGLPGENAHAPDEWMSVENFEKGIHACAELLLELGKE